MPTLTWKWPTIFGTLTNERAPLDNRLKSEAKVCSSRCLIFLQHQQPTALKADVGQN
ncbi:hypothetical protein PAMP_021820 [Pampus punctatissimus]